MLHSADRRLLLRFALADAQAAGVTLANQLLTTASDRATDTYAGKAAVGAAVNGHLYNWVVLGDGKHIPPFLITQALSWMLDQHDPAKAALIASGVPSPSDTQIRDKMLSWIVSGTPDALDFTGASR